MSQSHDYRTLNEQLVVNFLGIESRALDVRPFGIRSTFAFDQRSHDWHDSGGSESHEVRFRKATANPQALVRRTVTKFPLRHAIEDADTQEDDGRKD